MSGPRTKRQFAGAASDPAQRQITSFFTKTSSSSADSGYKSPNQAALNGPILPGQVQTDLLTVGMRVRKAIPEGYKTGSAYSAFTLWAEDTPDTSHPSSTAPSCASYSSTMRELEPFCGLNKVGGLAFQPSYNNDTTPDLDGFDDLDAMPGLTSSQDTIASTTSTMSLTTTTTRKRNFSSEEDEAVHDALSTSLPYRGAFRLNSEGGGISIQDAWLDEEVSPRSLAPPAGLWENARVLAVPRRPKQGGSGRKEGQGGAGQENVMVVVRGQDGNDFEEASFLDYGLGGEGRMEVE